MHIYQKALSEGEEQTDTEAPSDVGSELPTAPPETSKVYSLALNNIHLIKYI